MSGEGCRFTTPWWPSPRVWMGLTVGFALTAAVVGALARTVIFSLTPEGQGKLAKRFAAGAREVEVDPWKPWARIPRLLPGPADVWAGGTAHALRFPLGSRPVRRLVLYLSVGATPDEAPPRLRVVVNETAVTAVDVRPGTGVPSRHAEGDVHLRYKIRIPAAALGDGTDIRLSIVNESGSSVTWERIRLIEAKPTLTWAHLGRRGQLPPETAAFLAASLGTLLLWSVASAAGESLARRVLRATGPALALMFLIVAFVLPRDSALVAPIPRWLWLALPWVLLIFRPRSLRRGVRAAAPGMIEGAIPNDRAPRVRTFPSVSRVKALTINCALFVVALAVSVIIAEFALRAVFRDVRSAGDTRTYFHQPNHQPNDTFNSFGFREREFQLRKAKNTYRIALIGDSFTIGGPLLARVSNRLEEYLKAKRRPDLIYEVLNFGRTGADTEAELRLLRMLVLSIDPDFVLLQWYTNDVENGVHAGRPSPRPLLPSATLHRTLLRRSALYALIDPQWTLLQEKLGLVESRATYMYRRFGDPEGPDSVYAMERLKEFIDECRQRNTPVGLVLFPSVTPALARGEYEFDYLHDRVLETCREDKITCVDLRATFAAYRDYKQLWVTPLDGHPSPLANRLATERLIDAFGQIWLEAHS